MGSTALPTFPCRCRATYSWGGETKKDLGFIEGDLIEALNAGDGLWWMGRLRRDPRAIGLFPSNFVAVLDPTFTPAPNVSSRRASPAQTPPPAKPAAAGAGGVFRKPFQAYGSVGKSGSLEAKSREGTPESEREREKARRSKFRPYSSMKTAQAPTGSFKNGVDTSAQAQAGSASAFRVPSPPPRGGHSRVVSPAPAPTTTLARMDSAARMRGTSPAPGYGSVRSSVAPPRRPRSPLPSTYPDSSPYPQLIPSRQPSAVGPTQHHPREYIQPPRHGAGYGYGGLPAPPHAFEDEYDDEEPGSSPPPPPPPAHRVAYQPSRAASPMPQHYPDEDEYDHHGTSSPVPSPGGNNMTPSPLRDAMNDVMSSLHDMSVIPRYDEPASPSPHETPVHDPWSPDAYDLVRKQSQNQARAQSSFVYGGGQNRQLRYDNREHRAPSLPSSRDGPPRMDHYSQRMEQQMHSAQSYSADLPPAPPLKDPQYAARPNTSSSTSSNHSNRPYHNHAFQQAQQQQQQQRELNLRHRKSAYELGSREPLQRTYTTKTNVTNSTESSSATQSSTSTALTSRSIMSGHSAGGFSATSAGSLARRKFGLGSQRARRALSVINTRSTPDLAAAAAAACDLAPSETSGSGPSYHESHSSRHLPAATPTADWMRDPLKQSAGVLGGLSAPSGILGGLSSPSAKSKKSGFLRKMIDSAKTTAKTGAANARSTIGSRPGSRSGPPSPTKGLVGGGFGNGVSSRDDGAADPARQMGLGGSAGVEWMQVRRDVNRSNSLSRREREERAERCELLDIPVLRPIDQLRDMAEGDESLDGLPVAEPTDFHLPNLALVDKSTRFLQNLPPMLGAAALAQSYICRPHRTDVQRLRAIFTWVAERVTWEDDFEGDVDTRRVVQTKRGSSEEIAVLVHDMCQAVGLHAEVVHGYLKAPGEALDLDTLARPNHWWNAVLVDGEWRLMDCALASPTHPRRSAYSSASSQIAESWYFLARPLEICYTHIPLLPEQQHIVPSVPHDLLVALPCAGPTYFRYGIELADFETSALHLDNLEMTHLHIHVPEDIECVAEVEARGFARDVDGDVFESGDVVAKPALAQPEWISGGRKRFTVKALLPGDEGRAVLKVYAGKRGLMHSVKDNPHSLAFALPLAHAGPNPPYDFLTRHPTPHAQRHDLYVAQPQCARLGLNNTFVFSVRQHPSSLSTRSDPKFDLAFPRPASPNPYALTRPGSAMSMVSASAASSTAGSQFSAASGSGSAAYGGVDSAVAGLGSLNKPAKLAIQSPSQRITRLTRKPEVAGSALGGRTIGEVDESEGMTGGGVGGGGGYGSTWETVIKVGERGTWRGLVLADRSARWCVFAEWECV